MKTFQSIYPLAIIIASISGCNKDTIKAEHCISGKAVKSVENQKGRVVYDSYQKGYAVYMHIPGTIDAVDVGFVCENSKIPKEKDLEIIFSGSFYPYFEDRKPMIGGQEYYFLNVTSYEIAKP